MENKTDVKNILEHIVDCLNLKDINELGDKLGVKYHTYRKWIERGKIADVSPFVKLMPGISIDFLETGALPLFVKHLRVEDDAGGIMYHYGIDENDVKAMDKKQGKFNEDDYRIKNNDEGPPRQDLHQMVDNVLDSKTVYRPALRSNIVAFDKAIKQEV